MEEGDRLHALHQQAQRQDVCPAEEEKEDPKGQEAKKDISGIRFSEETESSVGYLGNAILDTDSDARLGYEERANEEDYSNAAGCKQKRSQEMMFEVND